MDLKKKKLASEREAYLNNIVRHIKAPARIRARIRMDLLTEIEAQEEAGIPFSDFKLQKGDPIQVAATFNEAYSGTDIRKRYYIERGFLITAIVCFALAIVLFFASTAVGWLAAEGVPSVSLSPDMSVGIIGGTDGPTEMYVTVSELSSFISFFSQLTVCGCIALLIGLVCLFIFWRLRRKL